MKLWEILLQVIDLRSSIRLLAHTQKEIYAQTQQINTSNRQTNRQHAQQTDRQPDRQTNKIHKRFLNLKKNNKTRNCWFVFSTFCMITKHTRFMHFLHSRTRLPATTQPYNLCQGALNFVVTGMLGQQLETKGLLVRDFFSKKGGHSVRRLDMGGLKGEN